MSNITAEVILTQIIFIRHNQGLFLFDNFDLYFRCFNCWNIRVKNRKLIHKARVLIECVIVFWRQLVSQITSLNINKNSINRLFILYYYLKIFSSCRFWFVTNVFGYAIPSKQVQISCFAIYRELINWCFPVMRFTRAYSNNANNLYFVDIVCVVLYRLTHFFRN